MTKTAITTILLILLFTACGEPEVEQKPIVIDIKPKVMLKPELMLIEEEQLEEQQKQKTTFIWDEHIASISQKEYDEAMLKYAEWKYPQRVKTYKIKQKEKIRKEKSERAKARKARDEKIRREKMRQEKIKNESWKDRTTGLIWQKKIDTEIYSSWSGAKKYCRRLILGESNNWRLPNKEELLSLMTQKSYENSQGYRGKTYIKKPLLNSMTIYYQWFWSATEYNTNSSRAWFVSFDDGNEDYTGKYHKKYVRCVREDLR